MTETKTAREKFYLEKLPIEKRTATSPFRFGKDKLPNIAELIKMDIKDFIFMEAYPKRPIPESLVLSFNEDTFYRGNPDYEQREDGYELIWELVFSDAMNMENWGCRLFLYENVEDTLKVVEELCECIPEIVALMEEK